MDSKTSEDAFAIIADNEIFAFFFFVLSPAIVDDGGVVLLDDDISFLVSSDDGRHRLCVWLVDFMMLRSGLIRGEVERVSGSLIES